jgi:signal transduction histidine kinase
VVSDLELRIEQVDGQVILGPLDTSIEADASQIRQLLQNLIGNGLKFHPPGQKPQVQVQVLQQEPGWIILMVADNGIGFSMEYAERIFQPFQRLHGRAEFDGSGMGLAICHKIAERHRGRIYAESQPGQGSRFYVRLPLTQ